MHIVDIIVPFDNRVEIPFFIIGPLFQNKNASDHSFLWSHGCITPVVRISARNTPHSLIWENDLHGIDCIQTRRRLHLIPTHVFERDCPTGAKLDDKKTHVKNKMVFYRRIFEPASYRFFYHNFLLFLSEPARHLSVRFNVFNITIWTTRVVCDRERTISTDLELLKEVYAGSQFGIFLWHSSPISCDCSVQWKRPRICQMYM